MTAILDFFQTIEVIDMPSTAIIPSPGVSLTISERSIAALKPLDLVPAELQQEADDLVERAEIFELVGNATAESSAIIILKQLSVFIKSQEDACDAQTRPLKAAISLHQAARDLVIQKPEAEKSRIKGLLSKFCEQQALKREQERQKAEAEAKRLRDEAAKLEREKLDLAAKLEREAREKSAAESKAKREAEEKAELERKSAAEAQERLKREREEAERRGTAEQMEKARKAEADAKAKAEAAEAARVKAQKESDDKSAAEKAKVESDAKRQQEELMLRQAELHTQAADASKSVVAAQPKGLSGSFKWVVKPDCDITDEAAIRVCMEKAFAARPDLFDISPRLKVIQDELKKNDGFIKIEGLRFTREYSVKTTR